MALQIRRGTDSQRLTITPAEGELIYTTDTDKLYIGDGSTVGGIEVSGGTDSAAVEGIINAASIDAATLNGENPSYYLDYNNLSNIPATQTDSGTVDSLIINQVNKAFVDNLNVDADTLDSQDGAYYLDYTNFTNTPTIPTNNSELSNGAAYVTQAAVDSAITALIDGAPGALDTLNELAAALGDDSAFNATITNQIALKLNKAGDTLTGTLVSQNIEPSTDDTYDLGSTTKRFRDLYLGPGSLYVNNKKVIEDESGTITFKTDSDQNLNIKTQGTGQTTLQSDAGINLTSTGSADVSFTTNTGNIELNGDVIINSTNSINSSNSDPINFGDNVDLNSNKIINVGTPTNVTDAVNKTYVDTLNVSTFTNDAGYVTSVGTDSATVTTIVTDTVDAAYVQARQTAQDFAYGSLTGTPTIPTQVSDLANDAGYITSADAALDSAEAINLIDSSYVQARQTAQDFAYASLTGAPNVLDSADVTSIIGIGSGDIDFGSNKITYSNVYSTEADLPSATDYHGMFAHVHTTGAGYFAHAGNWIRLANQSELAAAGVDSAGVTALVDSNYVQARQANASPGATTINTTTITATAGQTVFSVNYTVDKLNVYLNGILLDPTDYTATNGTSITLDVAASVNDIINIITYDTVAVGTPTINTFEYTATANQTTFTGSDDNSAILEYTADKLNVYLNGILLAAADYTATNGSSVVLATAAAASDVVSITAYKPGSVGKLDSDGVGNLIDSAYIQARQTTQDFAFSSLTGTPTTIAGYGITDAFDGAYSSLTGTPTIPTNNNELTNGAGYLTTSDLTNYRTATQIESMIDSNVSAVIDGAPGALDTLNELAAALGDDANFSATVTAAIAAKVDSADVTGIVDAAYVQARQTAQDFAYSSLTGAPTNVSDFTNDVGYLTAATAGGLDSANVSAIITADVDKAFVDNLNVDADTLDGQDGAYYLNYNNLSNTPTIPTNNNQLTNGAGYITSVPAQSFSSLTGKPTTIAGYGITDAFDGAYSSLTGAPTNVSQFTNDAGYITTAENMLDSAEALALITGSDLDMGGNKVLFGNVYANVSDLPNASTYHGMFAHVHATGAAYFAHAGNWIQLANNSDINSFDGAYSSLTGAPNILDSADVTSIANAAGGVDSAAITGMIDSAYVQARQSGGGSISSLDRSVFTFTATANQTVFTGTAGSGGTLAFGSEVDVYLNGILLDPADYTLSGNDTVTLGLATAAGNIITVIDYGATSLSTPTISTFNYIATAGQTSFSGNDKDSQTLSYTVDKVNVYANGVLLVPTDDFVATTGNSVVLQSAASAGDIISIVAYTVGAVGTLDSAGVTNLIDTTYIQARQSTTDLTNYRTVTQIESMIDSNVNSVIDAAPGALDTLNELAAALGDDANFSTTVTGLIAAKIDSAAASNIITADVDKAFVDNLNVDADTLDGQDGAYYLDYSNFNNTPTIPTNNNQLTNGAGYLTSVPAQSFSSLTGKPTTLAGYGITDGFDGAYGSLTGTPTNVSDFTNDAGYLTSATAGGLDSANVSAIITSDVDAAYVQARQSNGYSAGTVDAILIDGNSNSDTTYDNVFWTAGSDTSGSGYNQGGGLSWNSTDGKVTVSSGGLYEIKFHAYLTASGDGLNHNQRFHLWLNGSPKIEAFIHKYMGSDDNGVQVGTATLPLNAGDYIQIRGASGSAWRPRVYGGSGHTYLQVIKQENGVLDTGIDSSTITSIIDSNYVIARAAAAGLDSSSTTALIDSAYVQARQTSTDLTNYRTATQIESMIDSNVNAIVDAAPGALDTLNELAAALGDDANFSTTVTNSIAAKIDSAQAISIITSYGYSTYDSDNAKELKHNDGLFIKRTTEGTSSSGAKLRFTSRADASAPGPWPQIGTIEYFHTDDAVRTGSNDGFKFSGTETNTAFLFDGILRTGGALEVTSGGVLDGNFSATDGSIEFTSNLNMNNNEIISSNYLTFNDPGVGEGIRWTGGNGWEIFESPDNFTNASGNLQFSTGTSASDRMMTIGTNGNLELPTGRLTQISDDPLRIHSATNNPTNGARLEFSDEAGGSYAQTGTIKYEHANSKATSAGIDGAGEIFTIEGTEDITGIKLDGRLLVTDSAVFQGNVDFGSNQITYSNVYSTTSDLPSASTYHGMFAHVHATGKGYFAHAGNWIELANNSQLSNSSNWDTAYGWGDHSSAGYLTSATTTALVDSAYVQARQISGGGGGVDSAAITGMIDSAYVQARQTSSGSGGISSLDRSTFTFTATAGQTVFTGTAGSGGTLSFNDEVDVYINGILLDASDYTLSGGNTVTLVSGTGVNNIVTIIDYGASALTMPSLKTYEYTANANQTTFFGVDDNNETLAYSSGKYNVYLNGILLKNTNDYTATNGTSVVLQTGVNAGDVLQIVAWSEAIVGVLDSDAVTNLIDASYINGLGISAGLDSAEVISVANNQGYLTSVPAQSFSSLTGKPTTIAGYGITDAFDGTYGSLTGTPTIPTNNNQLTNGAGYITGYTVTQSDVTGHQSALSITESQISDLGTYLTSSDLTNYRTTTQIESMIDSNVNAVIDAAPGALNTLNELAAALGDDANFSTTITNQIAGKLDSAQAIATITGSDLDMGGNKVLFANMYSTEADLPNATTYHGMFAHVHATGAGYFAHGGNWIRLANQSELAAAGVDSAGVTGLIDSNYVQARQATATPGATTINTTTFTATAGQTSFSVSYTVDKLNVYLNGILLDPTDYTATNGSTIVLASAASVNDIINVITYDTVAVGTPTINTFEFTATANQTSFTGSDDNGSTLEYEANKVNVYLNGILLATADYTATDGSSIVLGTAAAVSDVVSITTYKAGSVGKLDSDGVTNLIDTAYIQARAGVGTDSATVSSIIAADVDSAYVQARQTTQDFAYSSLTGAPTIPSQVSDLTNDAGYITSVPAQSFSSLTGKPTTIAGYGITDAFDGDYNNLTNAPTIPTNNNQLTNGAGYLVSSDLSTYATQTYVTNAVNNVIDAAPGALDTLNELAAALGDDANFSTTMTNLIGTKLDSAQAIATITGSDLDMGGNKVLFGNLYASVSDLPSASTYHGMFAHVHATGKGYFAHAGNWIELANQSDIPTNNSTLTNGAGYQTAADVSSIITNDVDASFVNALGISAGVDSAGISSIITADVDQAFITNLGFSTDGSGGSGGSGGIDDTFVYTATSNQTAFTGADDNSTTLSYTANSIMVYLNGILLIPGTDYTATDGSTVTLTTGANVNDEILIVAIAPASGSSSSTWTEQSGNYTASAGDKLFVDVSSGTATVTLPASPSMGDEVRVIDATGNCSTNNITISRNGSNINGAADNLVLDVNRAAIGLAYYNSTQGWVLIER